MIHEIIQTTISLTSSLRNVQISSLIKNATPNQRLIINKKQQKPSTQLKQNISLCNITVAFKNQHLKVTLKLVNITDMRTFQITFGPKQKNHIAKFFTISLSLSQKSFCF